MNILFFWVGIGILIFAAGPGAAPAQSDPFAQGVLHYKKGEYSDALNIFRELEKVFKDPPFSADLAFMQGQVFRGLRSWPEAAEAFSRAGDGHPLLADYALFFQGESWHKAGEGEKSLAAFRRLIELYPQSLLVPQARLRTAEIHAQSADFPKAAEVCELILQGKPWKDTPAQAWFLLGQAREGLNQYSEAIQAYQETWRRYPLHGAAEKARARWESLAREKKITPPKIPGEALLQRALQFYQANQFETALKEMNRIEGLPAQKYPSFYAGERWVDDLYYHRGLCYFRLKQYAKAVENLDLVVRSSRNEGMAEKGLFSLFQALVRSGRREEALRIHDLLQAAYPRSSFLPQALHLKAGVYEDRGERDKAVSFYLAVADQFPQSPFRFPALWNVGWIQYQKREWAAALQAWERLKKADPPARWLEKALYWNGKALEKMGRAAEAKEQFRQLRQDHPTSYYSQLVSSRGLGPRASRGPFPVFQDPPLFSGGEMKANSPGTQSIHLEKGKLLARLALNSWAFDELEAAEEDGGSPEEKWIEVSRLYREIEEYYRSNLLVRRKFALKPLSGRSSEKERILHLLAYPPGNPSLINRYAQAYNLDPALLAALILEESRFQVQALSPAGARGLMQVMPQTGRQIAKELKVRPFSEDQLYDPAVNIRLGSWYFARMLEEFEGKVHLALAAYNAGPGAIRKWLAGNNHSAEDEFVENIPYLETRNYVIRVIGSAQVYRELYWPHPLKPVQP
ncbi:MAG: transglycosylase SLT domain-containing protein [Syntrophaceae bacterium]|nr:transglycosylase SLT domain-containing protein [Syntrophaceae bacterium]